MPLLDLLSALRICLAYTNYYRLISEIKEEIPKCRAGQQGNVCGHRDGYKKTGQLYCYLEIEISLSPHYFLPYSYPPPFCSNGRAQMLCCLSLCFSTYGESPAQNNVPLGKKRCFGVVVSFAAIGGMGFGALIRWGLLHQRWFYKESILSRPCVVCPARHLQHSPYMNIWGAGGISKFINGSLVLQQGGQGNCRPYDAWLFCVHYQRPGWTGRFRWILWKTTKVLS